MTGPRGETAEVNPRVIRPPRVDRASREDRDPEPAILMDEIPKDLLIRDLGAIDVPLLDHRSRRYPEAPVSPHERLRLFRTQGLRRDLVNRNGDPMLREKLPRLDAAGSPLQSVEDRLGHTAPVSLAGDRIVA